jgi:hypothetical protein
MSRQKQRGQTKMENVKNYIRRGQPFTGAAAPLTGLLITEEEARRAIPAYDRVMKKRRCARLKIETMREIAHCKNLMRRLKMRLVVIDYESKAAGL